MRFRLPALFIATAAVATLVALLQGNLPGLFIGGIGAAFLAATWAEAKFGGKM